MKYLILLLAISVCYADDTDTRSPLLDKRDLDMTLIGYSLGYIQGKLDAYSQKHDLDDFRAQELKDNVCNNIKSRSLDQFNSVCKE